MKIENTEVYGFRRALYGMRRPMSSHHLSDSSFWSESCWHQYETDPLTHSVAPELPQIGPNDLALMKQLTKAGSAHSKFLRLIEVWTEITIPRYIWQELDTYKVATVRMSSSTRPSELKKVAFTIEMFQDEDIDKEVLDRLNYLAEAYRHQETVLLNGKEVKGKEILRQIKKRLPEGYLQGATYKFNYQSVLNVYFQRKNHWLSEWKIICEWIQSLPYIKKLIE